MIDNTDRSIQLEECRRAAHAVLQILDKISSGMPESQACHEAGLDVTKFRRSVMRFQNIAGTPIEEGNSLVKYDKIFLSPAEKLYLDIMEQDIHTLADLDRIPHDVDKNMEILIRKKLKAKETKIIRMVYWEGLTQTETARRLDIWREQVYQIRCKALRALRHPECLRILANGFAWEQKTDRRRRENTLALREEAEQELEQALKLEREGIERTAALNKYYDINNLELSTRARNALSRGRIADIRELGKMTCGEIINLRDCGRKTTEEICLAYRKYTGKTIKDWKEIKRKE